MAVKIIQLEGENGLTLDCLKKEVISTVLYHIVGVAYDNYYYSLVFRYV